ncbi:hypothetical protein [Paraburkholderia bryophila]|uniref:Uncharacterized protein n=1 Tax=Paraburkholderia bryophila TaxID=420952 RepID=A0A7Y9WKD4_9BURK|nr:hypothetical protein [Paraburkholderia bryophila]NYH21368.1 hypothetical protein [Paraburkholderia bryophila]
MNQTSSLVTGGVTLTAASLVPLIEWVATGCKGVMPPEVQLLVAGAIVTSIHAIGNVVAARTSAKQATAVAPAQQ